MPIGAVQKAYRSRTRVFWINTFYRRGAETRTPAEESNLTKTQWKSA